MRIISKLMPASKWKLVISSIGVLALVVFSAVVLFQATKAEVDITENGEKQTVKTHANTVGELLAEVGITVKERDELSHGEDASIEDRMDIEYKTAKQIIVTIDGDEQKYYTTVDTIGDFLNEENFKLTNHDDISHKTNESIEDGLHISIDKAYQITINDGGEKTKVWTTGGTIKQLLNENDIAFGDSDKIKPGIKKEVKKGKPIKIVRVETETEKVEEAIAFETETKKDSSLAKGKEQVVSEGKEGIVVKKFEKTLENGKEVDRELIHEKVKEKSKNRVVAIGTKEPPKQSLSTLSDSSDNGGKVLYMTATGYTAKCNGCSGITATGINLNANPNKKVVAVDPNVIPLGTRVWVEGYGEAVAGDTGGAIKGNRIDIHVPTKAEAYKYNWKKVKVKILD